MNTSGLATIFAEQRFFAGLSEADIELISGCAKNVRFDPGAVVFREGEPADTFYLVRAGRVGLDIDLGARPPHRALTVEPGEILGWSWLFEPYTWSLTATALEATRALAIDGACLRAKCEADPRLGYELMKRFSRVFVKRLADLRLQLADVYGQPR